jgi:hypothetical protein
VRGDKAGPMHVVILRDFAPRPAHPQGDFAAAMPLCDWIIWRYCARW